jgi:hypothetical protein
MEYNQSAEKLKKLIEKAIEDQKITRDEYDKIIHFTTKDGDVDKQEMSLLWELQQMIENKMVKIVAK